MNVGGNCLPAPSQPFACNIANCQYCISNNYCGICNTGYQVLSGLFCMSLYSPISNCLYSAEAGYCNYCQQGYINFPQNAGAPCIPVNPQISCTISGCSYCATSNSCAQCFPNYQSVVVNGITLCQSFQCTQYVPNCVICASNTQCSQCYTGYYLDSVTNQCQTSTGQMSSTYCSTTFQNCQTCYLLTCLTCNSGYYICGSQCCPLANPTFGCLQHSNYQNSGQGYFCGQCQPGLILYRGMCLYIPCHIPNCQFCYRSSTCKVCSPGYVLS